MNSRRITSLMRRGGRAGSSGGGGAAPDYLFTPAAGIPCDGNTGYELITSGAIDSRLFTGAWTMQFSLGAGYNVSTEHLLRGTDIANRFISLSTGNFRLYGSGTNRQITWADLGEPVTGDTCVLSVDWATGLWSIAVNGGAPVSGNDHPAAGGWPVTDMNFCSDDLGVSSDWSGTVVYPPIGV